MIEALLILASRLGLLAAFVILVFGLFVLAYLEAAYVREWREWAEVMQ